MNAPDQAADRERALIKAATIALFVVLTVVVCATFGNFGISWDEMLQNTYGLKLIDFYSTGFKDRSAFSYVNLYLYGGLFDMVAALANTISPFGEYETRHLLGGLVFVAGLIGGWKLTNLLAGPRAALLATLCLATTPLLFGHAFINPKDSPFAWLGVWCLYYGCRIVGTKGRPGWGALAGFAVSLGLAMGTRAFGVGYALYVGGLLALQALIDNRAAPRPWAAAVRATVSSALPLLAVAPLALLLMAVFWPWSVFAPGNLASAIATFSRFTWQPVVLWSGQLVDSADLPRLYVLELLLYQLPEFILLGLALAAVWAVAEFRSGAAALGSVRVQQYLLVVLSVALPLAAFSALRPVIYNGLRHFLFVVPPLVILAAIALARAIAVAAAWRRQAGAVVAGLIGLALVREAFILVDLHPYEYISYNVLTGGTVGAEKRFELDYWGTSLGAVSRGLVDYIARHHIGAEGAKPRVYVCGDRMSAAYFLPDTMQTTDRLTDADFYVGINDPPCRYHFENPPSPIFAVQRDGVTLGYALDLRKDSSP